MKRSKSFKQMRIDSVFAAAVCGMITTVNAWPS